MRSEFTRQKNFWRVVFQIFNRWSVRRHQQIGELLETFWKTEWMNSLPTCLCLWIKDDSGSTPEKPRRLKPKTNCRQKQSESNSRIGVSDMWDTSGFPCSERIKVHRSWIPILRKVWNWDCLANARRRKFPLEVCLEIMATYMQRMIKKLAKARSS